jgi:hypothetical protein
MPSSVSGRHTSHAATPSTSACRAVAEVDLDGGAAGIEAALDPVVRLGRREGALPGGLLGAELGDPRVDLREGEL